MEKIQRATEIHRSMTQHQMALRIVELEDDNATAVDVLRKANDDVATSIAKFAEYSAKLDSYDKRITELQDALELAEEAVLAKHFPDAAKMVLDEWQMVPKVPTRDMITSGNDAMSYDCCSGDAGDAYLAMLSAAPKLGGE